MTSKTRDLLLACLAGGVLACGLGSASALAAGPSNLGTFGKWTAWQHADSNGKICYISATPDDTEPKNVNRDPIHFLVISREKGWLYGKDGLPIKNTDGSQKLGPTKNEVQTIVGYPLQTDKIFTADVDGTAFNMITVPDEPGTSIKENYAAYLKSVNDGTVFVAAMKAGRTLVMKGLSTRGTNTVDTYSLSGVTAAMGEIDKVCNW